jgi:hypothetical protein
MSTTRPLDRMLASRYSPKDPAASEPEPARAGPADQRHGIRCPTCGQVLKARATECPTCQAVIQRRR